jgi:hypothetical protein
VAEDLHGTMWRSREVDDAPVNEGVTSALTKLFAVIEMLRGFVALGREASAHPSIVAAADAAEKAQGILQKAFDDAGGN